MINRIPGNMCPYSSYSLQFCYEDYIILRIIEGNVTYEPQLG